MMEDHMMADERAEFIAYFDAQFAHLDEGFAELYQRFDRLHEKTYRIQRALLGLSDALTQQNYLQ